MRCWNWPVWAPTFCIIARSSDSIIEDKTTERNNDRQDLAAGIMNDWEYRMKWYNEDEATAKKMLPNMENMTDEEEEEIE